MPAALSAAPDGQLNKVRGCENACDAQNACQPKQMSTRSDTPCSTDGCATETAALLRAGPEKHAPRAVVRGVGACALALLAAAGLSAAVLYFTGLTQCWMLLGGADPAAWWGDAVENQDLSPGLQGTNCTACISAAPLVLQGCPFDEIGFYLLAGAAAAVPNFILCAVLVALCAARGKIADSGRGASRPVWGTLAPPGGVQ